MSDSSVPEHRDELQLARSSVSDIGTAVWIKKSLFSVVLYKIFLGAA